MWKGMSMGKEIISQSQRTWLLDALDLWKSRNLLSATQAEGILGLYETQEESVERQRSHGVFVLMGIAALLVGLAFLLVIAYNWESLGRSVKLAIIFGVLIGTHTTGYALRYRWKAKLVSEIVFFVGCLVYGGG